MPDYLPLLLIFIGGSILTAGDIVMKKWVASSQPLWFVTGMILYVVGLVFLAYSYKYKNIAVASTIFVIFNIITLAIVSWFCFKEALTPLQAIGIALGIGAVLFLESA